MTDISSLTALRLPLMTPLECGTQWIAAVNPMAGGFQAPLVYEQVQNQVGTGMVRYETHPDPEIRIRKSGSGNSPN